MSWERLRGHEALVASFERIVQRGRLAHAYLFAGPPGIGKRRFARELARTLQCEATAGRFAACDRCPSCVQIEAGSHPDVVMAGRPADKHEWPIELMREVLQGFGLKSARGKGKIAILDDVDDFNDESANCFLKTLEEPPPKALLILVGTSPERQMATILSRCQIVRFAPLPEPLVVELLGAEGLEPSVARRLARLSGGSPGQAKALSDPALWTFRETFVRGLTERPIESVALAKAWTEFVGEAGKDSSAQRERASLVLRLLLEFLSDALRIKQGGTPRLEEPTEKRALENLANRLDEDQLLEALERCLDADTQIDRRVQLVLVLEALMDALGDKLHGPPQVAARS